VSPAKSRRLQGSRGRTLSKMWAGALLLTGLFASGIALAESDPWRDWDGWADTSFTPLQLSLIGGPTQIFKEKVPVLGLRLSGLYANQSTVKGLDLGTLNRTDDLMGLGVGLANIAESDVAGVQLGVFNRTDDLMGLGVGLANIAESNVTGLQLGIVQYASDDVEGVQLGVSNVVDGKTAGAQLGVTNVMENGKGLQIGFWNVAEEMEGLQIGLVNINGKGFLPIFPLFNFGY